MSFANVERLRPIPMTEQHRPIKKLDFTPSSDELIRKINQAQLDDFDRRLAQSEKARLWRGIKYGY